MKRGLEEHMVYKHGIAMSNEDMEILSHQVKMLRRIKKWKTDMQWLQSK